jgi:hypothetical protein
MDTGKASVLRRVALIAAISAALIGVAVYQSQAIMGRSSPGYRLASGGAVLEPVDGSTFIRSYVVRFNGQDTDFGHYTSLRPSKDVIEAFKHRQRDAGLAGSGKRPPMLAALGESCSTFCYVNREGRTIGVVAYDNPDSGGCEYFVGAMPAVAAAQPVEGDCPGREPPDVPKPGRSTRQLCLENLGGVPSVMNFYEAWGRPSSIIDDFRSGMIENGWTERAASSRLLSKNFSGSALLSFSSGHRQCLVAVDQAPKTGKIIVFVFWSERAWLPEGVAL